MAVSEAKPTQHLHRHRAQCRQSPLAKLTHS